MAQNFPQSCQNWFLRVQTTILMKKNIFENWFFFRNLSKFFPEFWQKIFCKFGRTALKAFKRTMWCTTNNFFENFFFSFCILVKTFSEFSNYFLAKLWKLFSKNWYEHFNQKNLFWKILKFFRNRIQTFSGFWQKF